MAQDENVSVVSWPDEPASLEHRFDPNNPVPVTIRFADSAAQVIVATDPKMPLDVNMNMNVVAKEAIPVCIKLCEPICARSDYTIGLNIFDNPFASITVRGITQIAACGEEPPIKTHVDDLTFVEGIGDKVQVVLNGKGISTFKQLAETGVEQINAWLKELGWNEMDPKTWPEQADLLDRAQSSGKKADWDKFNKKVNWLRGGIEPDEFNLSKSKRKPSKPESPDTLPNELS